MKDDRCIGSISYSFFMYILSGGQYRNYLSNCWKTMEIAFEACSIIIWRNDHFPQWPKSREQYTNFFVSCNQSNYKKSIYRIYRSGSFVSVYSSQKLILQLLRCCLIHKNIIEIDMNNQRIAKRKSELKCEVQDFCINLQSSDPILSNLLSIMQWQASLDVQTKSILHNVFQFQLQHLKCKIKYELKYLDLSEEAKSNNRITELVCNYHKLKKFFAYCLTLYKKGNEVSEKVQKFWQYAPKPTNFVQNLQEFMNDKIIFDTIFHNYIQTYNVNIFTTDLIIYLYAHHEANLLPPQNTKRELGSWRNEDYEILHSQSINFKQLSNIHRKYEQVEQSLSNSYIMFVCHMQEGYSGGAKQEGYSGGAKQEGYSGGAKQEGYSGGAKQEEAAFDEKFSRLLSIISKINKNREQSPKQGLIKLGRQCKNNLNKLDYSQGYGQRKIHENNKHLLNEVLFGIEQRWENPQHTDTQFTFMKKKIMRAQILSLLNEIIKSHNAISHIYNQLDLGRRAHDTFQFQALNKLIESEFLISNYIVQQRCVTQHQAQPLNYQQLYLDQNRYVKEKRTGSRIIYPSTLNSFYKFIECLAQSRVDCPQQLIKVLEIKSKQMQNIEQAIVSIYEMIDQKQINCYKIEQKYIEALLLQSNCWRDPQSYSDPQYLLQKLSNEEQKTGLISQIIYQFDHNYPINEILEAILAISNYGIASHQEANSLILYRLILSEIVQIRNRLKLDHYFSLDQIHQKFSLMPHNANQIHFSQIVNEICEASSSQILIPKLLLFFDLQLKFKTAIFKLQLYWSANKELIHNRKSQAFKQFIQTYCSPIFYLIAQCHSICEVLDKTDEIEKLIEVLHKQVTKIYLIEKIKLIVTKQREGSFPQLDQHLKRLTYASLESLSCSISIFNPIETNSKQSFLLELEQNINKFSAIRLEEMGPYSPQKIKERAKLAGNIYLIESLVSQDIGNSQKSLARMSHGEEIPVSLEELKRRQKIAQNYQECLERDANINYLTHFYDNLILISIQHTISELTVEGGNEKDCQVLSELTKQFHPHEILTSIHKLLSRQFEHEELSLTTKYHQIYQLMYLFKKFQETIGQSQNCPSCSGEFKSAASEQKTREFMTPKCQVLNKLHYLCHISPVSRLRLQRKLFELESSVAKSEPLYRKSPKYGPVLRHKIYEIFCNLLNTYIKSAGISQEFSIHFDGSKGASQYFEELKQRMIKLVSSECKITVANEYGQKNQVEIFGQILGYELAIVKREQKKYKIGNKRLINKKAIYTSKPAKQMGVTLQQLAAKSNAGTIKKTLETRKVISKLQLAQKKMRDEITWQTSRLEQAVKQKINQFVRISNVEQQQSYINFKHTVNLQTIKGIENVIEEQTEMYIKKHNNEHGGDTFLTGMPTQQSNKDRPLDTNIAVIIQNMRKIKIFGAWKMVAKKDNINKKQWINFNRNVRKILCDRTLLDALNQLEQTRNRYLNEDVQCEIIQEANFRINSQIQQLKIENLSKKVTEYRNKLLCQ